MEGSGLAVTAQQFRLANERGSLGLRCNSEGLELAGAPLLQKTLTGFKPKPPGEIGALLKAAYGPDRDGTSLSPHLGVIADALNRGDVERAMVSALRLRLPELSWRRAVSIARVEDSLAKYDPDEPRDSRGRWTTGDQSAPATDKPDPQQPASDDIRPDVIGVVRPGLNLPYIYHPFESLSPGQERELREELMPKDPRVNRLDARRYKPAVYMRSPYFTYAGIDA